MQPDLLPLVRRQGARLLPDPGGHGDAADVVDERRAPDASRPRSPTSQRPPAAAASPRRRTECPTRYGETRSAKSPIAARARSIASPSRSAEGTARRRASRPRPIALVIEREDLAGLVGEHAAIAGSNARPARSRTTRAACSAPPSRRWKAASRATCTIRSGSGISPVRPAGLPLPSQRSVRRTKRSVPTGAARVGRSASPRPRTARRHAPDGAHRPRQPAGDLQRAHRPRAVRVGERAQ